MKKLTLFTLSLLSLSSFANFEYINGECWSCSNGGKFIKANFGCLPERKSTPISVSLSYCGVSQQQAQQDLWSQKTVATNPYQQPQRAQRVQQNLNNYQAPTAYAAPQYQAPTAYVAPQYQAPTAYVAPQYQAPAAYVDPQYQAPTTYAQPRAIDTDRAIKKKQVYELERELSLYGSTATQTQINSIQAQINRLKNQL